MASPRPSEEFKRDAVRIALTSGLTRRQVSSDLGVGMSTLGKWINLYRDTDVVSSDEQELLDDNKRLRLVNVTSRGYRAWRNRPASDRQRRDMVLLAHIREQHRLSLNRYGRPRMTEELKELGLDVGHRRIGRLMCQSDITAVRTQIQDDNGPSPDRGSVAKDTTHVKTLVRSVNRNAGCFRFW